MGKRNHWVIAGGILLGAAVIIGMLSAGYPAYSALFRRLGVWISAGLGAVFSIIPVPLSEFFILLVPLACIGCVIYYVVKYRRHGIKPALSRLFFTVGLLAFVFEAGYGVYYTAPPLADVLGLDVGLYTNRQLADMTGWLLAQANAFSEEVPRDKEGNCSFGAFGEVADGAMEAYRILAGQYPVFDTPRRARPKQALLLSNAMSYLNVAGYYFPFTGEGVVSNTGVDSHYPFSTAHEAAHSMGVGPEDEANFAAFLACAVSADVRLAYSGYLNAYVYAANALFAADPELYRQVADRRGERVVHDLTVHREFLQKYQTSTANKVGTAVNDAYIRATGQPDGIQSYSKVVNLLLAYYIKTVAA